MRLALAAITLAALSFSAGMAFEKFRYNDLCLDMGGGRNPGNYPICVLGRDSQ